MPLDRAVPGLLLLLVLARPVAAEDLLGLGASGLVLPVPPHWRIDRSVTGTLAVLRSPPPDDLAGAAPDEQARGSGAIAVVVTALAKDDTQGGFALRAVNDLDTLLSDYDPHDHDFDLKIGSREFQFLGYSFRTGQLDWEQELYITSARHTAVVLTCGSDAAHFAHWQPLMRETINALGGQ